MCEVSSLVSILDLISSFGQPEVHGLPVVNDVGTVRRLGEHLRVHAESVAERAHVSVSSPYSTWTQTHTQTDYPPHPPTHTHPPEQNTTHRVDHTGFLVLQLIRNAGQRAQPAPPVLDLRERAGGLRSRSRDVGVDCLAPGHEHLCKPT